MLEKLSSHRSFGGWTEFYEHASSSTKTPMRFAIYRPDQTGRSENQLAPALFWLSGLSCNEQNFITKAGAQRWASELGVILVAPDTSPRGAGISGEDESWDFGTGAGFYVNATEAPWSENYRMYDYVARELYDLVLRSFPVDEKRVAISGHSMGGHGAMVIGLRNPESFFSISAFSPICRPMECPWGEKAFSNYLGADRSRWREYDACELIQSFRGTRKPILIDQGREDPFLKEGQLLPEAIERVCQERDHPLQLRMQDGYDHSYYFVSSFIEDHLRFHFN